MSVVDADTLRRWFHGLNRGIANLGMDPEHFAEADAISAEIEETLRRHAGATRARPRRLDDRAHALDRCHRRPAATGQHDHAHAQGDPAGRHAGAGPWRRQHPARALLGRPEQLAIATSDPATWAPMAVNEGLRWIAPIGVIERQATVDVRGQRGHHPRGRRRRVRDRVGQPGRVPVRGPGHLRPAARHALAPGVRCRRPLLRRSLLCPACRADHVRGAAARAARTATRPRRSSQMSAAGSSERPQTLPVRWDAVVPARRARSSRCAVRPRERCRWRSALSGHWQTTSCCSNCATRSGRPLPPLGAGCAHRLLGRPRSRCPVLAVRRPGRQRQLADRGAEGAREPGTSRWIHEQMKIGDRVDIGPPRNHFHFQAAQRVRFIAGGIGITALLPMIAAAAEGGRGLVAGLLRSLAADDGLPGRA